MYQGLEYLKKKKSEIRIGTGEVSVCMCVHAYSMWIRLMLWCI